MSSALFVLGAGGHAKVVLSTLRAAGMQPDGILDDREELWDTEFSGVPVLGPISSFAKAKPARAVIAVGSNSARKEIAFRFPGAEWVQVVHPRAVVDSSAVLGEGTVVFAGAVIQPEAVLGRHCIVNTAATVDHDCRIGDFVHLGPGVHLCGGVAVGEGVLMGISSSAIPGATIGAWSTVGAGGVVVEPVEPGIVAVGIPARPRSARGGSRATGR